MNHQVQINVKSSKLLLKSEFRAEPAREYCTPLFKLIERHPFSTFVVINRALAGRDFTDFFRCGGS